MGDTVIAKPAAKRLKVDQAMPIRLLVRQRRPAVQSALPLTGNPVLLRRLASFYLALFFVLTAIFYVNAYQDGDATGQALLSCSVGGIACLLQRFREKNADEAAAAERMTSKPVARRSLLSVEQLLRHINEARNASKEEGQIGLALIAANVSEESRLDPRVLAFMREYLFRRAQSRVYEIDGRTLAIFERDADIAARLASLSSNLQAEFRSLRQEAPAFEHHRLTVGVAIATDSRATGEQLLVKAKSATSLAEELKRETFMRQV
jgi:hypothetical protein